MFLLLVASEISPITYFLNPPVNPIVVINWATRCLKFDSSVKSWACSEDLTPQNKWIAIAWDGCFTLVLRPHLHSGCFHFRSAHHRSVREEGFLGSDVCWSRHRISERERTTSPAILWRISVESEGRASLLDKCLASVCCVVCVIHCYLSRDTSFHICVSVWSSKGVMWWCWRTILVLLLLLSSSGCDGRRKTLEPRNPIEDVDSKRLEELIDTEEYLVVFFCEYWNFIFL